MSLTEVFLLSFVAALIVVPAVVYLTARAGIGTIGG